MKKLAASLVAFATVVTIGACSSSKEGTSTSAVTGIPCDVDAVLEAKCRRCHGAKPSFGAPMPLVTWDDVQAGSRSDPTKKTFAAMLQRINDPKSPMPQGDTLSPTELATLNRWLQAGAPKDAASCANGADGGTSPVGPEYLPCPKEEQTVFTAHGDTEGSKYAVPADAGNSYMCFSFKSPWSDPTQQIAFAPIIDDARVVHHWILFETAVPQTDGAVKSCAMPRDAKFLMGWAPGSGNRVMPPDIGQMMPGKDRWLILQVHYWNVNQLTDARDRSGVALCTTTKLREKSSVISRLGTGNIALPARTSGTTVTGMCTPQLTAPVTIFGANPHMHRLGRKFHAEVLRGGSEDRKETIVQVDRFDFETQVGYPANVRIEPGDKIRTTCTYDNPGDTKVYFGEKTENEMCFGFLAVWPSPGLINAAGAAINNCMDAE